ncbi:SDR family oxidoreductase, partial [bacterium]|nr:SDR family oxidoreductase [bacterium]
MESNTKKTVFLTGGTGFLGGHLGREFLSRGWHVLYLARAKRTVSAKDRVLTVLEAIDP